MGIKKKKRTKIAFDSKKKILEFRRMPNQKFKKKKVFKEKKKRWEVNSFFLKRKKICKEKLKEQSFNVKNLIQEKVSLIERKIFGSEWKRSNIFSQIFAG